MDIRGKNAAALNEDGTIVRIHNSGYEIGQTIELHEINPVHSSRKIRRFMPKIAAAAALVAVLGAGTTYALPYGTVTLDGDPSIEYTINYFDFVLNVRAVNEEGAALLADLDIKQLRFHKIDSALTSTLKQVEQNGYLDNPDAEIRITAQTRNELHTGRLEQNLGSLIEKPALSLPESEKSPTFQDSNDIPAFSDDAVTSDTPGSEDAPSAIDKENSLPQFENEHAPAVQDSRIQNTSPEYSRDSAVGEMMPDLNFDTGMDSPPGFQEDNPMGPAR